MSVYILLYAFVFHACFCGQAASETDSLEELFRRNGLVDIHTLDPGIQVNLKYSSLDNFLERDIYGSLKTCWLQREIALKLVNAQKFLKKKHPEFSLIVFDAVRPRRFQRQMWDMVKGSPAHAYVANPDSGSFHNYGAAVDLSIADAQGRELDMGTPFDWFGELAQPRHEEKFLKQGKLTQEQVNSRKLLRAVMTEAGFLPLKTEWWHFNGLPGKEIRKRYNIIE
ncbi:MAG: M15 family metallopeptidase [Desulfobacterales bacterium]